MLNKQVKDITPIVVIFVLILIIAALMFTLFNNNATGQFPLWVKQAIVAGVTTLLGAFIGAFLAGQFAIISVNKQINFMREQKILDENEISKKILKVVHFELLLLLVMVNDLLIELNGSRNFKSIKRGSKLMRSHNLLFKDLFRNPDSMSNISFQNFYFVYQIPKIIQILDSIDDSVQLDFFENHPDEVELIKEDLERENSRLNKINKKILVELELED